jgi:hypothetical protein
MIKLSTLKMINWEKVVLKVCVNRYLFKTKVQFLHLKPVPVQYSEKGSGSANLYLFIIHGSVFSISKNI